MKNFSFKKTFIQGFAFIINILFCSYAQAQMTKTDLFDSWWANRGTKYTASNNAQVSASAHWTFGRLQWIINSYDPDNNTSTSTGWTSVNVTINGEEAFPGSYANDGTWEKTYDFDENGKLKALYDNRAIHHGDLIYTYKYTENGKLLVYNPQGELIGTYNNFYDQFIATSGYFDRADTLNLTDENGNYIAKDENNKILEAYYRNGDYIQNLYNENANLISSKKYDKDGHVLESLINKYDAGGNLIAVYENGVATYRRRIYTPSEATAAVQNNKNKFSIIYR